MLGEQSGSPQWEAEAAKSTSTLALQEGYGAGPWRNTDCLLGELSELLCECTQDGNAWSCLRWWGGVGQTRILALSTALCPGRELGKCSVFAQLSRTQSGREVFIPVSQRPSIRFRLLPAQKVGGDSPALRSDISVNNWWNLLFSLGQRLFQRHFHILLQGIMGRDGRMGKNLI